MLKNLASFGIIVAIALVAIEFSPSTKPSLINAVIQPGCKVKGNISVSRGRKLYHIPGMEDYESTVIDPSKGEKWFCSESEAIANGWQKAPK